MTDDDIAYDDEHRCPATTEMFGRVYRCEKYRGHTGFHYDDMGRIEMVQWPDGWYQD